MKINTFVACLILAAPIANADVTVGRGFLTGNEFRSLNSSAKINYAMGITDGFVGAALVFGEGDSTWIGDCLGTAQSDQVVAIFEKYLVENPGEWHYAMNVLAFNAFNDACRK